MVANGFAKLTRLGALVLPLGLVACGGGGGDSTSSCTSTIPGFCSSLGASNTGAAATSNNTNTNTNAGTLFSTAPSAITLNAGSSTTYTVGGGTPPYTATSGNTNVGKASISGTTLSLSGISAGTSPIVVVDSVGKAVNIALTVLAQGQAGTPLSVTPGALTVGDCTTNIPFIFSGGVAPYTVFTSDNFAVPVSSPLPIGANSYFTASVRALNPNNIVAPQPGAYAATLTVLDSQSRTATATITVPSVHVSCPSNPLLAVFPESANFRLSEIRAFQVSGGASTGRIQSVTFSDASIATVSGPITTATDTATVNVQALKVGTTLMTISSSDGQKANIPLIVLPQ